ncbi:MAG: AAA family ATPase [Bacteroidota bacterium]
MSVQNSVDEFLNIFVGRQDRICTASQKSTPVTDENHLQTVVQRHLDGIERIGFYNLLNGNVVRFGVIDFDSHGKDATYKQKINTISSECQKYLSEAGIWCYREISKSGFGNYHIWIFFDENVEASIVRLVLHAFINQVLLKENSGLQFEIFPKQDGLTSQTSFGSMIWLPLFPPDVKEYRTVFIDEAGNAIEPDFKPNSPSVLDELVNFFNLHVRKRVSSELTHKTPIIGLLNGVEEGERNISATRLAGLLRAQDMPIDISTSLLELWNQQNHPPLATKEISSIVQSIWRYEVPTQSKAITYHTGNELLNIRLLEQRDLVGGLIREQSVAFLSGEVGCGKSIFAMNLGISVAIGAPNILNYQIQKSGKVLFLNNELYFNDYVDRFQKMAKSLPVPAGNSLVNLIVPERVPPLLEYWDNLEKILTSTDPALVILDCLYWAHDKRENDAGEMKEIMRRFIHIRDVYKCVVLVVHHMKKGAVSQWMGNDNMRGSGVFGAGSDTVLELRRTKDNESKRILKPVKLRHSTDAMRTVRLLGLNPETLWFHDEGATDEKLHIFQNDVPQRKETIDFTSILKHGESLSRGEIIKRCTNKRYSDSSLDRFLDDALRRKILKKTKYGQYGLV